MPAKVFISYEPKVLNLSAPSGDKTIIETFVGGLEKTQGAIPDLTFFFDKHVDVGTNAQEAREQAMEECVAFIGLVANGENNRQLSIDLADFCNKPQFMFRDLPRDRIFLFGAGRSDDFVFRNSEAIELRGTLLFQSDRFNEFFNDTLPRFAEYMYKKLPHHPSKGRIVLGLGVPFDNERFRENISKEITGQLGYDVVELKFESESTPDLMRRKLKRAMRDAKMVLHFLHKNLEDGWRDQFFLDLQIEVAKDLNLPEMYCSGPAYKEPQRTPSRNYGDVISRHVGYTSISNLRDELYTRLLGGTRTRRDEGKTIYLYGERRDRANLTKIEDYLRKYPWKVERLDVGDPFEGFKQSKFLLVYWGQGTKRWYLNNMGELKDAKVDDEPLEVAGVYFAEEDLPFKQTEAESVPEPVARNMVRKYFPLVAWDAFSETRLAPFIQAVQDCD